MKLYDVRTSNLLQQVVGCKPGEGLIAGVEELEGCVQTQFHLIHPGKGGGGRRRQKAGVGSLGGFDSTKLSCRQSRGLMTDPDGITVHVYTIHGGYSSNSHYYHTQPLARG